MSKGFIADALDSKIVPLDKFSSVEASPHFVRLRLFAAAKILFGDYILIPQGWSVDSMVVFHVIGEIAHAMKKLEQNTTYARLLSEFDPFKIESHVDCNNYLDLARWYFRRDDCYWSGLPLIRGNSAEAIDARNEILAAFSGPNLFGDGAAFEKRIKSVIQNEIAAKHWTVAAEYFSARKERFKRINMRSGYFHFIFKKSINVLLDHTQENIEQIDSTFVSNVRKFHAHINAETQDSNYVSGVLRRVSEEYPKEFYLAVEHFAAFSQILAASSAAGADFSSPAIGDKSGAGTRIADDLQRIMMVSNAQVGSAGFIANPTSISSTADDPLFVHHINADYDWDETWVQVIKLALDRKWKQKISEFLSTAQRGEISKHRKILLELEKMLSNSCDKLVIRQPRAQALAGSLSFELSDGPCEIIAKALNAGMRTGAAALGAYAAHKIGLQFEVSPYIPIISTAPMFFALEKYAPKAAAAIPVQKINPFEKKQPDVERKFCHPAVRSAK